MEETSNFVPAEPASEAPQPRNALQRFVGIFTSPLATLQDIAARPEWITPMAILVVLTIILAYLMMPAILADAAKSFDKMAESGKVSADQLEKMQEASQGFTRSFGPFMGGLYIIISSIVAAAVLLFVGNIIMAGKANFRQMLSIYVWTGMVTLIGSILRLPLALKQNTMAVFFSPAAFIGEEGRESLWFKISASLDVFTIWRVILLGVGFAALYRFGLGKSLAVIVGLYVLMIAVSVSFSGMF